jgi:hypothetical protein
VLIKTPPPHCENRDASYITPNMWKCRRKFIESFNMLHEEHKPDDGTRIPMMYDVEGHNMSNSVDLDYFSIYPLYFNIRFI